MPSTIPPTTAVVAPAEMPMTSGLASGLRVSVWNNAPDIPSASPTNNPTIALGIRQS
jgi:hypothetical protein